MHVNTEDPRNRNVLRYLASLDRRKDRPALLVGPDESEDVYMGTHPDATERLWTQLGGTLPQGTRAVVLGRPALVHPAPGLILAFASGTEYVLRIPSSCMEAALAAGCEPRMNWGGGEWDLEQLLEPGWVFGGFHSAEKEWLAVAYSEAEAPPAGRETP